MFLDFYKLREQPFSDTPDPRFAYFGEAHREAIASLFYGIDTGRGFLTLTAPPGMGKTTILFHLLERLRDSVRTAFLFQTQCDSLELLRYLLTDLGIATEGRGLVWMHEELKRVLLDTAKAGKRFVLFIDEAQNLTASVLESVRLLSDFENPRSKLIQIVLAGQPQLADKLARSELTQLRQRISIRSRLRPFTLLETGAYIKHRLQVAGYEGDRLFSPAAWARIFVWSGGVPRNINNLCFNALTLGCALEKKEIHSSLVLEAINDLEMTASGSEQDDSRRFPQAVHALSTDAAVQLGGSNLDQTTRRTTTRELIPNLDDNPALSEQHNSQGASQADTTISTAAPPPLQRANGGSDFGSRSFRAPTLAALIFLAAITCTLLVGKPQSVVRALLSQPVSSLQNVDQAPLTTNA